MFLCCATTSNIDKESESVRLLVLMTWMGVVEDDQLAGMAMRLLKASQHCDFVEIFSLYSLMEIQQLALQELILLHSLFNLLVDVTNRFI